MELRKRRILSLHPRTTGALSVLLWVLSFHAHAQDSLRFRSVADYLSQGTVQLNFRQFTMSTLNKGALTDYYALAAGGTLGYTAPRWRGLSFEFSGNFVFDLVSSNLAQKDSLANNFNRYEIQLFDQTNPYRRSDLDRVETLFLQYRAGKTQMTLGRQIMRTPFINPQDGRMRPSVQEGFWVESKPRQGLVLQGGWLWGFSPRATFNWYSTAQSIGIYPVGLDVDGKKSQYKGNLTSKGVGILSAGYENKRFSLEAWDYFVENIFNLLYAKTEYRHPVGGQLQWQSGLQLALQNATGTGGNDDPAKSYLPGGAKSVVISGQSGLKSATWSLYANYTRITADGRFLMPREWGREPFYTFLPRERNEGAGDVHAFTLTGSSRFGSELVLDAGAGYYRMPGVTNYRLNKYGMPSYVQTNLSLTWRPARIWKGFSLQALWMTKWNASDFHSYADYFNKTDMHHFNLILNYDVKWKKS